MKIIKLVFLLSILMIMSCDEDFFEQVVTVDIPEHTPALAVTANFQDSDETLAVYVSNSVGILDTNEPKIIENATVELLKDGTLLHVLEYAGAGIYGKAGITPLGNENATYRLNVSAPGFEATTATQQMPQPVNVSSVSFELDGTITPDGDRVNEIIIEIDDPSGIENYYSLYAYFEIKDMNGTTYTNNVYMESFNPIAEEDDGRLLVSDGSFDGQKYKLNLFTYDGYQESADEVKLHVILYSLTKDKYFFEKSFNTYQNTNDNPFAEPIVVHNNIENGHGIFTLLSKSSFVLQIL